MRNRHITQATVEAVPTPVPTPALMADAHAVCIQPIHEEFLKTLPCFLFKTPVIHLFLIPVSEVYIVIVFTMRITNPEICSQFAAFTSSSSFQLSVSATTMEYYCHSENVRFVHLFYSRTHIHDDNSD